MLVKTWAHKTAGLAVAAAGAATLAMWAAPDAVAGGGGVANDQCGSATAVTPSLVLAGDLTPATPDGSSTCDASENRDAWYSFHAICNGVLLVSTCGTNDGPGMDQGMDTVLSIHSECPGTPGNELACNDDWDESFTCEGDDAGSLRDSAIAMPMTADETVFVRVSHMDTELSNGTFVVKFGFTQLNDDCVDAIDVTPGSYEFCTIGATTDGPEEPTVCDTFSDPQVGSDVWYRYRATCNGMATVGLCGSNYDTKLAIYEGECPTAEGAVACNDDACGPFQGLQSQVSFPVTSGNDYLIRIGGFFGLVGSGLLDLSVEPNCAGDVDGSGEVDVDDLVAVILGWGGTSEGDVDCSGDVNVDDLVTVILAWGPCQ
jgi:hypothetical protein